MPPWLPPSVVVPLGFVLIGQALLIWMNTKILTVRFDALEVRWTERHAEMDRRMTHAEVYKLSTDTFVAAEGRMLAELSRVQRDINAVQQREIARAEAH